MQLVTLEFTNVSESISLGDFGYYASSTTTQGGFDIASNIIAFGVVVEIQRDASPPTVTFIWDDSDNIINATGDPGQDGIPDITLPQQDDYIMFGKNNVVNSSSLLGYYAEAKFVNNSTVKAELFSVGSEVSESSK